jgi:hypothetical protein
VSETAGTVDKPNRERGKRAKRCVLRVKALIFFFAESSHDDRIPFTRKDRWARLAKSTDDD